MGRTDRLPRPRGRRRSSIAVAVLLVVSLIAAACSSSDDDEGGTAGDSQASERPGTGWRLATYAELDGEPTLVAIGEARLDDDGELTVVRSDFSDGSVAGVVSFNEYGTFLGFPKPGRSISSDGRQWVHLAQAGVEDLVPESIPLEVDADGPLREVDTRRFGRLRVLSKPGQLVPTGDGFVVAQLVEEWVDDDEVVRRRLTWTAVVDPDGETEWYTSVADRDDSIDPSPLGTTPSAAMPLVALVRAAGATSAGPTEGEPTAPPPPTRPPPVIGEPGEVVPAAGGPGSRLTLGSPPGCVVPPYYDDRGRFTPITLDCPPALDPGPELRPPELDPPPRFACLTLDGLKDCPEPPDRTPPAQGASAAAAQHACFARSLLDSLSGGAKEAVLGALLGVLLGLGVSTVGAVLSLLALLVSLKVALAGASFQCDRAWGDPHIVTLDGTEYDFQGAGEFVTVKAPDLEVQQRYRGVSTLFSVLEAVAVRVGDHIVEVIAPGEDSESSQAEVRIDGEVTEVDRDGIVLDNGTYVALRPGSGESDILVVTPDGSWISIVGGGDLRAVYEVSTSVSEATASQVSGGISGTPDGDGTNDFTLRDGTVVPLTEIRTFEGLYGRFGSDWRVRPEERLFSDTPAEQWLTAEIVSFPASIASLADFTPEQIAEARAQCEEAGVTNPATLDDCAYDVLVSGDPAWAEQAGINAQPGPDGDDDPRGGSNAPLLVAAANCDLEALETALNDGESPNLRRRDDGWTPLHFAAQEGCSEGVRLLAERGARLTPRTDETGELPLRLAAQNGHEATVAELLTFGAPPDLTRSEDGSTPMLAAAFRGHTAVVDVLLESGATVDVANDEGFTPLQAAVQEGYPEVAVLLLDHGADPDRPDAQGRTALIAAAANDDADAVAMLLEAGADPDRARASDGVSALHFAAQDGYVEVVRLVLGAGGDPNIADDGGTTPLHLAASNDQLEVIELLLAAGADPDAADDQGRTPRDVAGEAAAEQL